MLLVGLVIELVVFNFYSLESLFFQGLDCQVTSSGWVKDEVEQEQGQESESDQEQGSGQGLSYTMDISFVDSAKLQSIKMSVPEGASGTYAVSICDEGNSIPYELVPLRLLSSEVLSVHSAGLVSKVSISMAGEIDEALASQVQVSFNESVPFDISLIRLAILWVFLLLLWLLRAKSPLRTVKLKEGGRLFYIVVAAVLSIACVCIVWHVGHTSKSFYHHSQYQWMAVSLAEGHAWIDIEPAEELKELENPYDTAAREATGVDYIWDCAYYNGRYYMYFGILPVIVHYLPYHLLTGGNFPNWASVLISLLMFVYGLMFLLSQMLSRWHKDASRRDYLFFLAVLLVGSWCMYLMHIPKLYAVPIAAGLACLVWGLGLWVRATSDGGARIKRRCCLGGSLLVAATILCRPQLLAGALLGLVLAYPHAKGARKDVGGLLYALVPFVVVAAIAGLWNFVRFGNPFDFGANYNLTNNDMTSRTASADLLLVSLFYCLFALPSITPVYPYLQDLVFASEAYFGPVIFGVSVKGGYFALTPLALMAFPMLIAAFRNKERGMPVRLGAVCAVSALVIVAFDALAAGIVVRYFCDFGIFLALACVMAMCPPASSGRSTHRDQLALQAEAAHRDPLASQAKATHRDPLASQTEAAHRASAALQSRPLARASAALHGKTHGLCQCEVRPWMVILLAVSFMLQAASLFL